MKLIESIRYISSGTIAHLTGFSNCSQVKVIRTSFEKFANALPQDLIWQEAWFEFISSNDWELCRKSIYLKQR